jgi:hypothetical protein
MRFASTGSEGGAAPQHRLGSWLSFEPAWRRGGGAAEEAKDPWLCDPGFSRVCLCRCEGYRREKGCTVIPDRTSTPIGILLRPPGARCWLDWTRLLLECDSLAAILSQLLSGRAYI